MRKTRLTGYRSVPAIRGWPLRVLLLAGFSVFLLVAVGVTATGRDFLEYPVERAGNLILLVEAVIAVATAVTLAVLFAGAHPARGPANGLNGADEQS